MPEFSMPNLSVPNLTSADLSLPDFDMPDVTLPDPAVADLLQADIPATLDVQSNYGSIAISSTTVQDIALPDASSSQRPGELDTAALALVLSSPDNAHLPPSFSYNALETTDGLSRRDRHMGMLLSGLEGKMEDMEDSDAANPY